MKIPYRKLTNNQLAFCQDKCRQASDLLKKWSAYYGPRRQRDFRSLLFKGIKDNSCRLQAEAVIPVEELAQFQADRIIIIAIHTKTYTELDGNTVEMAMISGYSKLAWKHAHRWSKKDTTSSLTPDDLFQEAIMAIQDAIYNYNRSDIRFITFAWVSIRNRLLNATNAANPMCPLTNNDLDLYKRYEKARREFNDHVTFEQVAEAMCLSDKEYDCLSAIMTRVFNESQMGDSEQNANGDTTNDYTELRYGIDSEKAEDKFSGVNVREAIERADLTDFERQVLVTSMEPYYGWQTDLASKSFNPKTGKPYSRMWVTYALQSAQEKVKAALETVAA